MAEKKEKTQLCRRCGKPLPIEDGNKEIGSSSAGTVTNYRKADNICKGCEAIEDAIRRRPPGW